VSALLVLAAVVALVNVPGPAGLLAWGLAGGDGEPQSPAHALLALLVMVGALYVAFQTFSAFNGIGTWQWLLMWVVPAAGVLVLLVTALSEPRPLREQAVGLFFVAPLAVPPACVWFAGAVS
jgi:hypothetical protein